MSKVIRDAMITLDGKWPQVKNKPQGKYLHKLANGAYTATNSCKNKETYVCSYDEWQCSPPYHRRRELHPGTSPQTPVGFIEKAVRAEAKRINEALYAKTLHPPVHATDLNDTIKEILIDAASLVLTRKGDISTEDGGVATVDIDTILRLDYALAEAFELDSDDVNFNNMDALVARIRGLQLNVVTAKQATTSPAPCGGVVPNKYHRQITGICGQRATVDVYRVLHAFPTGLPEIDHAVKKLLAPGQRGAKDRITDLREAAQSIECAIKYLEQVND